MNKPTDITELKRVFAKNLNRLLDGTAQIDVARALNIEPATFSSWCVGKRMPRMDKVEMLANYFGVKKSELIEEEPDTEPNDPWSEVKTVFDKLSPDNRAKLLELAHLYLAAQSSNTENK